MKIVRNIWLLLAVVLASVGFVACENDEDTSGSTPIVVSKIYLEDTESSVVDRPVEFIRTGQVIRIEGSGFVGMRNVYINGYNTYFNPVYVSDNSMLLQLSGDTPITEAEETDRNIIHFVKTGTELKYPFIIRAAAPSITSISHTLPLAGEQITIYGKGLHETTKVIFPGNKEVTEGIISDEDGEFVTVTVPTELTESGSVFVEGANGGAYSPAYFNCKSGVILDFDGLGKQGFWNRTETSSMMDNTDLESAIIGTGNVSQGNYCAHRPARFATLGQGKNRLTEVWTAGTNEDDWDGQFEDLIPVNTLVSEVAFQFDVYVPQEWANTGFLKICLVNNFSGGEWAKETYNYVPWVVEKAVVPFKTEGWTTVTIPFSKFYAFSATDKSFTFQDVLKARKDMKYQNFGMFFENSDFNLGNITKNTADAAVEFASSVTSVSVYTDNWRVVSLATPTYTDFPEEAAE